MNSFFVEFLIASPTLTIYLENYEPEYLPTSVGFNTQVYVITYIAIAVFSFCFTKL